MSLRPFLLAFLFLLMLFNLFLYLSRDPGLRDLQTRADRTSDAPFSTIVTSDAHSCAIAKSGSVWCWGRGTVGQLGHGLFLDSDTPVPVVGLPQPAKRLTMSNTATCAILVTDRLWCWGGSSFGEIGLPESIPATARPLPLRAIPPVSHAALGPNFLCFTTLQDQLFCRGERRVERDGAVYLEEGMSALSEQGAFDFDDIAAGQTHACGRTQKGALYCWGGSDAGALGDMAQKTNRVLNAPTRLESPRAFAKMSVSDHKTCALEKSKPHQDVVWCWGDIYNTRTTHTQPHQLFSNAPMLDVQAGADRVCALHPNGRVSCQGKSDTIYPQIDPLTLFSLTDNRLCGLDKNGAASCLDLANPHIAAQKVRAQDWQADNRFSARWQRLTSLWIVNQALASQKKNEFADD